MAQFELVWIPIIIAILFSSIAIKVLVWRKSKLRNTRYAPQGSASILILGISLFILAGFSLFTGMFFLITG